MKALLLDIKTAVDQAWAEGCRCLEPREIADWKAQYGTLLAQGYQANPPNRLPEAGK